MNLQPFFVILRVCLQIGLLALIYYGVLRLLKGTPGLAQMVTGAVAFGLLYFLVSWGDLPVLRWVLAKIFFFLPVIIAVLFQAEIRRLLGLLALKFGFRRRRRAVSGQEGLNISSELDEWIRVLCCAVKSMSQTNTGALIAIERNNDLESYCARGMRLHASLVPYNKILESIFYKGTPLHDGGVIIRNNYILDAAKVPFPLCEDPRIRADYGTRHQAAVGLSEVTDAIVIVVSEANGAIHFVKDNHMLLVDTVAQLEEFLQKELTLPTAKTPLYLAVFHGLQQALPRLFSRKSS